MAGLSESKPLLLLAAMFTVGLTLQLLGCVLFNNWWPMLVLIVYVIVPMPFLIFGSSGDSRSGSESFVDAGKLLSGFAAIS